MSLLELQSRFRDEIAASDDGVPASSAGMQIYRDAYRGRLLAALEVSFERTRRWVGDEAFTAAGCHYVLTHSPRNWTLDSYGSAFPEALASLFGEDPEVAELAWLEWHMQQAFAARDVPALDPAELAAAGYGETEWEQMRFTMAPGFAARKVTTNLNSLWTALETGKAGKFDILQGADQALIVWREHLSPRFRELSIPEYTALEAIAQGRNLGGVAAHCDADLLGQWLAKWLSDGIFATALPEG